MSIRVGDTTTLPPGSDATVSNSGTEQDAILNFGIPAGIPGEPGTAPTIEIGQTESLPYGTAPYVVNHGSDIDIILDFGIPQGKPGDTESLVQKLYDYTSPRYTVTPISTTSGEFKIWQFPNQPAPPANRAMDLQATITVSTLDGDTLIDNWGAIMPIFRESTAYLTADMFSFAGSGTSFHARPTLAYVRFAVQGDELKVQAYIPTEYADNINRTVLRVIISYLDNEGGNPAEMHAINTGVDSPEDMDPDMFNMEVIPDESI